MFHFNAFFNKKSLNKSNYKKLYFKQLKTTTKQFIKKIAI